jgi:hypothetical protein
MIVALLGNPAPQMQVPELDADGIPTGATRSVPAPHVQQSVTRVEFADYIDDQDFVDLTLSTSNDRVLSMIARSLGDDLRLAAVAVAEIEQVMAVHSAGAAPTWVAVSSDTEGNSVDVIEAALAQHFDCMRGEPMAILTTVGRDALHAQHMSTSAPPATFNFVGLSANLTAVSAASTTLPGEITTAGGGLIRKQVTYAHTATTNTSTLTGTFTANGTDSLPVTVAKIGVLNALTVGTLAYETLLNATATLTISGDNVTVTETVTGG